MVVECHSIQQIGLVIRRMVEDWVRSERTDRSKVGKMMGEMVTGMVGTCMLTDTYISSGSAGGDPIEISVVLAML